MEFKPQSTSELEKNFKRIKDIVVNPKTKVKNDVEKQIKLARTQANRITTPEKAYNRGYAAKELGYDYLFDIFYERAFELNAVSVAEIREHNIRNLLGDD